MSEILSQSSFLEKHLRAAEPVCVALDGQILLASQERCPAARALLPGSFNPVHDAHWRLAEAAERILGAQVAFELSVANVDKPSLAVKEIRQRLAPFNWQAPVWLTHAPRFVDKASLFPGAVFVVGADTALRVVSPRYYENSSSAMENALARIQSRGCRFLVACRVDERGKCWGLSDLSIPEAFASLFEEIAAERFRMDLSSSQLRLSAAR
jgi:hypothetical protein